MSKQRALKLNEWWAVRNEWNGFVIPRTAAATQGFAKALYMDTFRNDLPYLQKWRNHREGYHGLSKVKVVRVLISVVEIDEAVGGEG